ncbi:hypothetical protein [Lentzea nigeriaca]|uniref:hypothetical protein n=1 Tax=Lentzea nigeriaca TaxID=1128665 RepID=UPI0019563319|nr:hypothetical protein [Lentzea nigeriaca]MBM7857172.1 hypothetical protein [Lentzea nigeriaca]
MSAGTLSGLQQPEVTGALLDAPLAVPAPDGVDELCERLAEVCRSATDPLEIAASLEFDGLNDQAVQAKYGFPDVFALAEEMHRRVPVRPTEPESPPDPWRQGFGHPALHGLLYSLPAVCFPAATGLLGGPGAITVLLVSMLASWSASQGLAYLGYLRLGRGDDAGTRHVLRWGMLVLLAGAAGAVCVAGTIASARPPALAFAVGQGLYLLSATVLMVLRAERLMLVVLAPGCLAGAGFLVLGKPSGLALATACALAATPLLGAALALWLTRGGERKALSGNEVLAALPSALFGLLAALLIAFPVVPGWGAGGSGVNPGALLAAIPLSLSMGAAEWTLYWYRRRCARLLRGTGHIGRFRRRSTLILLAALAQYLTATVVLVAAVVAGATALELVDPKWTSAPQVVAYLALGGAMFLALLLQTMGCRLVPLVACGAAFAAEFTGRGFGVPAQLVATGGLLLFLTLYAVAVLGKAIRHG